MIHQLNYFFSNLIKNSDFNHLLWNTPLLYSHNHLLKWLPTVQSMDFQVSSHLSYFYYLDIFVNFWRLVMTYVVCLHKFSDAALAIRNIFCTWPVVLSWICMNKLSTAFLQVGWACVYESHYKLASINCVKVKIIEYPT